MGPRACLYRCGKPRPYWDSLPDRPAHSESLYRLYYPGPHNSSMLITLTSPHNKCAFLQCMNLCNYIELDGVGLRGVGSCYRLKSGGWGRHMYEF